MPSIVPCLCWVPKGAAKRVPDRVQLKKDEIDELLKDRHKEFKSDEEDSEDLACNTRPNESSDDVVKMYNLDGYDDSDANTSVEGEKLTIAGLSGLMCYIDGKDDPYVTLQDDSDEEEDYQIRPTDNLLLVGKAEDELSSIEVHGNYVAVGTMTSVIDIWDLDLVDVLEPVCSLGRLPPVSLTKKKKSKKRDAEKAVGGEEDLKKDDTDDAHVDAVMGLAWNCAVSFLFSLELITGRSLLASASADKSVRIWDLSELSCALVLPHRSKVQALQWHPREPELLATGSCRGVVGLYNCEQGSRVKKWKVNGEVERVLWNHFEPDMLLVCTEESQVIALDKSATAPLFTVHAHNGAITDISLSCQVPGLLMTCSTDDCIKFWDIHAKSPSYLYSKEMHMGTIVCGQFCPDNPYVLAVGGQRNGFNLLNVLSYPPLSKKCKEKGLVMSSTQAEPPTINTTENLSSDEEKTELDFEPPPAKTRKKEHAKSSTKERKLKKSYKNKKVHKNK